MAAGAASFGSVSAGAARLRRRGVLVRCLAGTAPELSAAVETLWAAARRALLGHPPLSLRKL